MLFWCLSVLCMLQFHLKTPETTQTPLPSLQEFGGWLVYDETTGNWWWRWWGRNWGTLLQQWFAGMWGRSWDGGGFLSPVTFWWSILPRAVSRDGCTGASFFFILVSILSDVSSEQLIDCIYHLLWELLNAVVALMSNPSERGLSWCSTDKNPLMSVGFFGAFEGSGFYGTGWGGSLVLCCEGWSSPWQSCEHRKGCAGARQPSVISPCCDRSGSAVVALMGLPSVHSCDSRFNALGSDKGTLWQLSSLCNTSQASEVWVTHSSKGWLCGVRLLSTELWFFSVEGVF